jgi:hypothetical protein
MPVQFAMMQTAQRDCKLVAHFAVEGGWLGKLAVMGVGRAAADQTGLLSHKPAMFLVAKPVLLGGLLACWAWCIDFGRGLLDGIWCIEIFAGYRSVFSEVQEINKTLAATEARFSKTIRCISDYRKSFALQLQSSAEQILSRADVPRLELASEESAG